MGGGSASLTVPAGFSAAWGRERIIAKKWSWPRNGGGFPFPVPLGPPGTITDVWLPGRLVGPHPAGGAEGADCIQFRLEKNGTRPLSFFFAIGPQKKKT